ncbi:hypothetical protein AVEN_134784-1 [Araneus ventricosus]|uniref:RNase H type-1 domain-containing protein n=1 Tax=Araneus ventricosus TaxID=182803 RepID=A0A4Y2G8P7_ARAVE|nr:hypothetical protein AVEN_134784-1 [Araneus ventricosus]
MGRKQPPVWVVVLSLIKMYLVVVCMPHALYGDMACSRETVHSSLHTFCIYSDSMNALQTLAHPQTLTHPIASKIHRLLVTLKTRDYHILFCWIPSHGVFMAMNWLTLLLRRLPLTSTTHIPMQT